MTEFYIVATRPYFEKAMADLIFTDLDGAIKYRDELRERYPNVNVWRCLGMVEKEPIE